MPDPVSPRRSSEYSRLLSLTSHELRTPISVVAGYLRMLQKDRDQFNERHRKMIDEAEKACSRLVALISEISSVGKLEGGETPLRLETVDLAGLLREVATQNDTTNDRVTVAFQGDEQRAALQADRTLLKTAFDSCLRAVIREQIAQVVIVLDLQRPSEATVRVIIARQGETDRLAQQPAAAFDEFRGGIGLTLPIARRILELHGGRIWSPANDDGVAAARSGILLELPLTGE